MTEQISHHKDEKKKQTRRQFFQSIRDVLAVPSKRSNKLSIEDISESEVEKITRIMEPSNEVEKELLKNFITNLSKLKLSRRIFLQVFGVTTGIAVIGGGIADQLAACN